MYVSRARTGGSAIQNIFEVFGIGSFLETRPRSVSVGIGSVIGSDRGTGIPVTKVSSLMRSKVKHRLEWS